MNKKLLALSLIASPGLMADDASSNQSNCEQTGYCNTCCCTPCCCKPCCVPKPKKCIDCECYTPAFYDLQCDCGFFADVAFLYWYARETNLSYALKLQAKEAGPAGVAVPTADVLVLAPQNYKHLDTRWCPGVRVGIGWNSECDGWDYYLHWTYYRNKEKCSTSVPNTYNLPGPPAIDPFFASLGECALLNPWIDAQFHGNPIAFLTSFDKVVAKWRMTFNSIDLELGRKYWLSRCFNLRPFAGLRGAWTRTKFRTKSTRNFEADAQSSFALNSVNLCFKDRFKTRNWGVGLLGGLQPTWYFSDCFALYGSFDMALIWGDFEVKKTENYNGQFVTGVVTDAFPDGYYNQSNSCFSQMNAILDLALGLRWEDTWCCDQYRTALDLGWEHHIWFDHNHRNKSSGLALSFDPNNIATSITQYDEATGNLCYGGLVLRLRFEF